MQRINVTTSAASALALALGLLCSGCGNDGPQPLERTRIALRSDPPLIPGVTPAQRFRWQPSESEAPRAQATPPAPSAPPAFTYDLPAGWEDVPLTRFRHINTRVQAAPSAECYLTFLEGSGGGDVANVNRWRREVQLPEVDAATVAALPRTSLMGEPALRVDLEGPFTNMSGQTIGDARLVGVLLTRPNMPGALFVKFVGPADVVGANLAQFDAFVASIDLSDAVAEAGAAGERGGSAFHWDVPAGWQDGGPRQMREVTLTKGECELYVSVLDGRGGGLLENVNRWLKQFGQPPTDAATVSGFERTPCLGGEAFVVRAEGTFASMGGAPRAGMALLGAVLEQPARLVTVKLVGPAAEVAAEDLAFRAFVASLHEQP